MVVAEAAVDVDRPADVILEWIGDLERYRRADTKVARVLDQRPGVVRYRGRLRGLPTVVDENTVELVPGRSLTFRGAPRWTRRFLDFDATFLCEPIAGGGTRVVHREAFGFKPAPARWLLEAWLRGWLQREIEAEVGRLKALVEAER